LRRATGDAALNGTIVDAWQLPLTDVGIAGEDDQVWRDASLTSARHCRQRPGKPAISERQHCSALDRAICSFTPQGRTLRFKVTGLAAPTVAGGSAPEQPLLQFPFHGVRELTATSCYPDGDLTVDFSLASGHEGFQRAPYQTGAGLSLFCAIFAAMPKRCRWANGYGW
jgi:hypothetical protein